jgi:hypothetical protein
MVDVAVVLPESQPGDDEDVVWGLSTAAALWARGEHGDAIVWVRRAAEAAAGAGQEARAGELIAGALRLEHAAAQHQAAAMPPPASRATAETLPQDLLMPEPEPSPAEEGALALEPAIPPPPAAPRSQTVAPAPRAAAPPPSTARTPTITPPPPPTHRTPSVAPPPMVVAPPPPRGPMPSYTAYVASRPKSTARAPILDPWAENEPTMPSMRVDPALRAVQLEGDEVMVQLRRNQPRVIEDDDGVVTSAASIDATLRRAQPRPPTPPTRKWTATGEQPPGYIAEIGAVPSKSGAPARPRPPSPPASDAGKPVAAPSAPGVSSAASAPAAAPASSAPRPSTAPPGASSAAGAPRAPTPPPPKPPPPSSPPPAVSATTFDPFNGPTLPSTPSAINAPTLPATPSAIPRARPMTVPPPAAPVRVAAPRSPAPPAGAPSIRLPAPSSIRPPPPSASVPPPAPRAPASIRPSPLSAPRAVTIPPPAPRAELALDEVEAFADLSAEMRQHLASLARIEALSADEEVSAFGAALVIDGDASVCATIVDAHAAQARPGTLIVTRGTLAESVALRVVAGSGGARVAVWEAAAIEEALRSCPWVLEGLITRADELQAYAGATMGPLGELDDAARAVVLERLAVRVAPPREVILDAGAAVPGLILVCVGAIELASGGVVRAGEVLFPQAALAGAPAPSVARASASGAVFLVADRALSAELAASSPLAALIAR